MFFIGFDLLQVLADFYSSCCKILYFLNGNAWWVAFKLDKVAEVMTDKEIDCLKVTTSKICELFSCLPLHAAAWGIPVRILLMFVREGGNYCARLIWSGSLLALQVLVIIEAISIHRQILLLLPSWKRVSFALQSSPKLILADWLLVKWCKKPSLSQLLNRSGRSPNVGLCLSKADCLLI